mmetsp:Transcript_14239/g.21921  ORF Transcript_14239/g.21921 Transcript_14239/m.21921 type:complete len:252 (-) Transcript_14239:316-1071(-)|eukprot:CAMPEP_0196804948 /NCGR_PEP_ID=MMETSP1362-20130617/4649_1 /TAXON_ID=163516 /ORGANISM="Leptocylindrus danicus, Strain CCMP1856" /LENGTH=251 /DNA_ID=CAMNT_0042177551 /DNA_START=150 /DNA_END=905 /DNA_ORIENTATION=-
MVHRGNCYSRKLWDEARKPNAPTSALIRAVLYELQPVSLSKINVTKFLRELIPTVSKLCKELFACLIFVYKGATWRDCGIITALYMYYKFLNFAHEKLDAGPIVLILTALIGIFTIGLDDGNNDSNNNNNMSAYSVFNRGFARMLGNVDVESLVAQHVGGAMAIAARPIPNNENNDFVDGADNDRRLLFPADDDNFIEDPNNAAALDQQQRRPRRTGKKKRRQNNIEERRDRQRQRELAREMMGYVDEIGE